MSRPARWNTTDVRAADFWYGADFPDGTVVLDTPVEPGTAAAFGEWGYAPPSHYRPYVRRRRFKWLVSMFLLALLVAQLRWGRIGIENLVIAAGWAVLVWDPLPLFDGRGWGTSGQAWLAQPAAPLGSWSLEAQVQAAIDQSRLEVRSEHARKRSGGRASSERTWHFMGGMRVTVRKEREGGREFVDVYARGSRLAPEFRSFKGLVLAQVQRQPEVRSEIDVLVEAVR